MHGYENVPDTSLNQCSICIQLCDLIWKTDQVVTYDILRNIDLSIEATMVLSC